MAKTARFSYASAYLSPRNSALAKLTARQVSGCSGPAASKRFAGGRPARGDIRSSIFVGEQGAGELGGMPRNRDGRGPKADFGGSPSGGAWEKPFRLGIFAIRESD